MNSTLRMDVWRDVLSSYSDYVVCDLLEFGFPLDFRGSSLSYGGQRNHKGARDYATFVNGYVSRECAAGRLAGPFVGKPLSVPLMVSPLNTVPKDTLEERRVIVDLSWPPGASVNDGIEKNVYLEEVINLRYASVADVSFRNAIYPLEFQKII